jgi:hypothetical protein
VVLPNSYYQDWYGSFYLWGEICNGTTHSFSYATIPVNFYDSEGQLIETDTVTAGGTQVLPGEKACFRLSLFNTPYSWKRYQFGQPVTTTDAYFGYASMDITKISGTTILSGLIRNTSNITATPSLWATFYSGHGNVVGCGSASFNSSQLIPGQQTTFSVFDNYNYTIDSSDVVTYQVNAKGYYYVAYP